MQLFPQLDKEATFLKVQDFLYNVYPEVKRRAGSWGDYSSPTVDDMPKAPSYGNSSERRMLEHALYGGAVCAVNYAVKHCSIMSQTIIKCRYLEGMSNDKVKKRIGYSGNDTYYSKLKMACSEFADCLEPACHYYGVSEEIIPDLHVYQKTGQKQEKHGTSAG
ncbi:hypothetical protein H5S09_04125 [Limosilactobacillus sp. STM2_1]|uniref:ArpU family transcriptional regulator n=1 Tax=Limosilactobacillus rudii TaxID=2759755 RepID=A0A7W3UKE7_9LACO|nr:ArpU family phage packaging/lysis transcriptional regulator [Limosilactobacillus rudii]MBB1078950.1 hypothetical protein [Limosilactobacillus rudii]MBB1097131.1 hypothetical protein [Limosilactobacillus rudii]MCD7134124.1 hypothetical protein [Limosilactobacillus rudii]